MNGTPMSTAAGSQPAYLRNKSASRKTFADAKREQESVLAPLERRTLTWLAARMPAWVNPDRLTLLGFAAMLLAGAAFAAARWWAPALLLVNVCLAVNWFGDSLDGTLARFHNRLRPRYGFYVDHIVDAFSTLALLAGLGASGFMSAPLAAALLVTYFLLSINVYLATHTLGTFRLSYWKFSPTELRVLICLGNVAALLYPRVLGGRWLFYDVAGAGALAAMCVLVVWSVAGNIAALARLEPSQWK